MGLYLFGKAFVWCMKVLVIAVALMLYASAAVVTFLALVLIHLFEVLKRKRARA